MLGAPKSTSFLLYRKPLLPTSLQVFHHQELCQRTTSAEGSDMLRRGKERTVPLKATSKSDGVLGHGRGRAANGNTSRDGMSLRCQCDALWRDQGQCPRTDPFGTTSIGLEYMYPQIPTLNILLARQQVRCKGMRFPTPENKTSAALPSGRCFRQFRAFSDLAESQCKNPVERAL